MFSGQSERKREKIESKWKKIEKGEKVREKCEGN